MKRRTSLSRKSEAAPSAGRFANSGNGPTLQPVDIGHRHYTALVDPDTAFWSLVRKDRMAETLTDSKFLAAYRKEAPAFAAEMHALRFGLTPSAVYFNPTERCNLNCKYCYIPGGAGPRLDKRQVKKTVPNTPAFCRTGRQRYLKPLHRLPNRLVLRNPNYFTDLS